MITKVQENCKLKAERSLSLSLQLYGMFGEKKNKAEKNTRQYIDGMRKRSSEIIPNQNVLLFECSHRFNGHISQAVLDVAT